MKLKGPGWRYSMVFASVGLLITITLLLFVPFNPPWPKVLEVVLYLLGFLLLASCPPLHTLFVGIPKTQRWLMLSLAGILLVTQMRNRHQETFPFIPWNMYHMRFPQPPQYLEFIGVCPDGREVVIPVCRLFYSQLQTVFWRLQILWNQMEAAPDQSTRQMYSDQFRSILLAIVSRFNQQHSDTNVIRVRVIHCTMPRPKPGLKLEVTRRLLTEYLI